MRLAGQEKPQVITLIYASVKCPLTRIVLFVPDNVEMNRAKAGNRGSRKRRMANVAQRLRFNSA